MAEKPIYLNHAGTSWPKPQCVTDAAEQTACSTPDVWPEIFETSVAAIADSFSIPKEHLLITPGCTSALNLAIQELPWQEGDRILTSQFEHHALYRNLIRLQLSGVVVDHVAAGYHTLVDLDELDRQLQKSPVRLVAMTAACNVTGQLLNTSEVIRIAHKHGALVLIDGAQVAGWSDLELTESGIDLFAFAGHKGLQAPAGIGGLYIAPSVKMRCPTATCAISDSDTSQQSRPGYCDAGSVNMPALSGLAAACQWLADPCRANRLTNAQSIAGALADGLREYPDVQLLHDGPAESRMPTVAFRINNLSCTSVHQKLSRSHILSSAGFQCAPKAHEALGTQEGGVIRISFGPNSAAEDARAVIDCLYGDSARSLSEQA